MMRQSGLFGLSDHKMMLSADGDSLEVLARVVDFEAFRATVVSALNYSDRPLCIIRTQIHSCSFVCSGRWLSASRSRRTVAGTVGTERVCTWSCRWSPYYLKKIKQ